MVIHMCIHPSFVLIDSIDQPMLTNPMGLMLIAVINIIMIVVNVLIGITIMGLITFMDPSTIIVAYSNSCRLVVVLVSID